jgi:cyd operon protein YbgT
MNADNVRDEWEAKPLPNLNISDPAETTGQNDLPTRDAVIHWIASACRFAILNAMWFELNAKARQKAERGRPAG